MNTIDIVFDIGGTHLRAARVENGGLAEVTIIDTPQAFEAGVTVFAELIAHVAEGKKVRRLAGGIAGLIDQTDGTLFYSPNLEQWQGYSLKKALGDKGYADVIIENDASLAGLGEAVFGAGKGSVIMAYYTVSTGIGGSRIVDTKVDRHFIGFEPGKQIIDMNTGVSIENLISGHVVEKKYGMKADSINDAAMWQQSAEKLALAVFNSIVHWSPDTFVLGGPLMLLKNCIQFADVEQALEKHLAILPQKPKIVLARLGNESGLYGAMALLAKTQDE